ncbi:hypothetical protein IAG44_03085 [Streptomyces roseirectus]|uniref:Uncharacterized protein n=1 Tax=Streptomyces roseirectus TaxID=2768066 RepID=A0A7H0I6Z0_9ACTN|nr:hypothetical protein [Streptomyces roseirectus]QNP68556.1 hypothetical protein IAG44_03085 [Streptomyces roseirectus]
MATSFVTSFCELLSGSALTPSALTSFLGYCAYEFQKSESERGRSIPTAA